MAKDYGGWQSEYKNTGEYHELDWDSTIDKDYRIIDKNWVESKEIREPINWNPVQDLIRYLELLFDSTDLVGYVTETYLLETESGTVYKPTKSVESNSNSKYLIKS